MPTVEEKAAAFDALCREFSGKARHVSMYCVERRKPEWDDANGRTIVMDDVPVYEWTLRAIGCADFASVAISMAAGGGGGADSGL